jgi:hypothetical protein
LIIEITNKLIDLFSGAAWFQARSITKLRLERTTRNLREQG